MLGLNPNETTGTALLGNFAYSSMVEQLSSKQSVVGSTPTLHTENAKTVPVERER